jgi:hypothetical protein
MKVMSARLVLGAAALFVALDMLWLAAGNATGLAPALRQVLKSGSLVGAIIVYVALASHSAVRNQRWVSAAILNCAVAVGLALSIMIVGSYQWRRGQFFHDATMVERLPALAALLVVVIVGAGLFAPLIGALARLISSRW